MINKRINKDLKIVWKNILTNGEPVPLVGRDIHLYIVNPRHINIEVTNFIIIDNSIQFIFSATNQKYLGVYSLTIYENKDKKYQTALDYCDAFRLVETTCQESFEEGPIDISDLIELSGGCISAGVPGLSAYEIAVKNGYKGTEEEWLADLALTYDELTPEQIEDLQRPATEAAEKADEATAKANDAAEKAIEAAENIPVYLLPVKDVSEINI